jgi:hypothetical protein
LTPLLLAEDKVKFSPPKYVEAELDVRAHAEDDKWVLLSPLRWMLQDGNVLIVPAGFITDLASVPSMLRGVLDVNGKSRHAAVAHDWLYRNHKLFTRSEADEFLRVALICRGTSAVAARTYWSGVRIGGWKPWGLRVERGGVPVTDDFATAELFKLWMTSTE